MKKICFIITTVFFCSIMFLAQADGLLGGFGTMMSGIGQMTESIGEDDESADISGMLNGMGNMFIGMGEMVKDVDHGNDVSTSDTDFPIINYASFDDFKVAMDAYEAFFDEYIDVLKKMEENPSSMEVLTEYMDMLVKYEEAMIALDSLDEKQMTKEELDYYLKVSLRIETKLLNVLE